MVYYVALTIMKIDSYIHICALNQVICAAKLRFLLFFSEDYEIT